MSLLTRCPNCETTFKVVRDQLRISEGWVRCGRCSQIFDAMEALHEVDDDALLPRAAAMPQPSQMPATEARPVPLPAESRWPSAAPASASTANEPGSSTVRASTLAPSEPASSHAALAPAKPDSPNSASPTFARVEPASSAPVAPASPSTFAPVDPAPPAAAPTSTPLSTPVPPSFSGPPPITLPASELDLSGAAPAPPLRFSTPNASGHRRIEPSLDAPSVRPSVDAARAATASKPEAAAVADMAPALLRNPSQEHTPPAQPAAASDEPLYQALRRVRIEAVDRARAVKRAKKAAAPAMPTVQVASAGEAAAERAGAPGLLQPPPASEPLVAWAVEPASAPVVAASAPNRSRWWIGVGIGLALALLIVQWLVHERDAIVARQPSLRPLVGAACAAAGCQLSALRRIGDISIEGSSFAREKSGNGYRLNFALRNSAGVPLAMPAVELSLLDTQEQPVVRRVILPAEFGAPNVLPARSEQSATLALALSDAQATALAPVAGYNLSAFYP